MTTTDNTDDTNTKPYADAASAYFERGWHPLPLPEGRKSEPPKGFTGREGKAPSAEQIASWVRGRAAGNVALRLPTDVIGIDCDAYGEKHGDMSLAEAESRYGKLPATWSSTARDGAAGIQLYRVPAGRRWQGGAGADVDVIQLRHRYMVVSPSLHPDTGTRYRWYRPDGTAADPGEFPTPDDLPDLPARWIGFLEKTGDDTATGEGYSEGSVAWLESLRQGVPCTDAIRPYLGPALADFEHPENGSGSRHDAMNAAVWGLVQLGAKGHAGIRDSLNRLYAEYCRAVGADRGGDAAATSEFTRSLDGAIEKEGAREADSCDCDVKDEAKKPTKGRRIIETPFSEIQEGATTWLWEYRIPLGGLTLLGGREGIGKSTVAYDIAAAVTKGTLKGDLFGIPRAVLVVATEDPADTVVKPRLHAAGADMSKVIALGTGPYDPEISFPNDREEIEDIILRRDAAMLLLDPLSSRIAEGLDTHKDSDTRRGLEPLASIAADHDIAVVGLTHVNKSGDKDIVTSLMGSRAFTAVARSVLAVVRDDEDESKRILGVPKKNLAPGDVDDLAYTIVTKELGYDEVKKKAIVSGQVKWLGKSAKSVAEAHAASVQGPKRERYTCEDWLGEYLRAADEPVPRKQALEDGAEEGFSAPSVKRAAQRLGVVSNQIPGAGGRAVTWSLVPEELDEETRKILDDIEPAGV